MNNKGRLSPVFSHFPFTFKSLSRSTNSLPSALPFLSPRQEIKIPPDAREWAVWGYASPVLDKIVSGSTAFNHLKMFHTPNIHQRNLQAKQSSLLYITQHIKQKWNVKCINGSSVKVSSLWRTYSFLPSFHLPHLGNNFHITSCNFCNSHTSSSIECGNACDEPFNAKNTYALCNTVLMALTIRHKARLIAKNYIVLTVSRASYIWIWIKSLDVLSCGLAYNMCI